MLPISISAGRKVVPKIQGSTIFSASFSNPSTQKIWLPGQAYTGTIIVPTGYGSVTWEIRQHETNVLEASGSGTTVNYTFTYKGADKVNTYALLFHATKSSYPDLDFLLPGEFTCVPVFTRAQADRILTLSGTTVSGGSSSSDWTDYASWSGGTKHGFKIWVEGTYNGTGRPLNFFYWRSTDPMNPVNVIFDNVSITTTIAQSIPFGSSQNIIFNGCHDEAVQYGLTVNKAAGGVGENIYCTPSDSTHESYNWTMCGMHVDNGAYTNGGTGFVMQMTNNATFNANTYTFTRLTVFNMLMENVNNEAYYVGHTRDTDAVPYAKLGNCLYYQCNSNHSRNEGFQMGGHIQAEVFRSTWLDSGLGGEGGQDNNWQLNGGNKDGYVFMNRGSTAHGMTQQFPSVTGRNMECFSNILETTSTSIVQNWLISFVQSNLYADILYSSYNNLIIALGNTNELFSLYGAPASTVCKVYGDGNVFVSLNTTQAVSHASYNLANTIMNNKTYLSNQIDDLLFFNVGTKNYRLATLDSPLFSFTRNSTAVAARIHPWANYDYYGYKYVATNLACGPDGGFELMTGLSHVRDITSVASLSDITNVPNGTTFASLIALLPTKVLASMADGSTRKLSITWLQGSYNGNVNGTYALNGNLTLPADITNGSTLQAHINVTVLTALPPVSLKINVFTGTAAGWIETGSTSPYSALGTVDYGQLGTTGIGIRALNNPAAGNSIWGGTGLSGGTAGTVYPDAVQQSYWYTQSTVGASFELYEMTPGSNALAGRTYTIKILGARAGIAGPRTTSYTAESGQTGSVNVANNNDTLVTLTGVSVIGGVIKIKVWGIAPNDGSNGGHINGFELISE